MRNRHQAGDHHGEETVGEMPAEHKSRKKVQTGGASDHGAGLICMKTEGEGRRIGGQEGVHFLRTFWPG